MNPNRNLNTFSWKAMQQPLFIQCMNTKSARAKTSPASI